MNMSFTRTNIPPTAPIAALAALLLLVACDQQQAQDAAPPPPSAVGVTPVVQKDVTASVGFVGRVQATARVDLRARVAGFLEQRLFEEGGEVNDGDLLFVIEKAPYQAAVSRSSADVAKAEASRAEASATLGRMRIAVKSGAVSKQNLDEAVAKEKVRAAAVLEAKAAMQQAQLDLGYTDVRSPIKGLIGRERYTVGNLVGPESDPLATVVSQDPIYVVFPVSQRVILDYQKSVLETGDDQPLRVRLVLGDGSTYPQDGKIDFADITVSRSTDTLDVRAVFANPDNLLIDGQFVTVSLEQEKPESALVIPRSAMQIDQAGRYVLVVDAENKVELRRISTGQERGGEIVVTEGLKEGERIITQGIQKVRPGIEVQPTEEAPGPVQGGSGG
jgi:membrane fusion protein, multidrug efflux system